MSQAHRLFAILILVLTSIMLLSCGFVSGKPNTSAPSGYDNPGFLLDACHEREQEINAWEEDQKRRIEEEVADDERSLLGAIIKIEQIEEEAYGLRRELESNCQREVKRLFADIQGANVMEREAPTREPPTPQPWTPAPTWTPESAWTPEPTPRPTATPLPTPTPTLTELALAGALQCVNEENSDGRIEVGGSKPHEVLVQEDGSAYIKAGYFLDPGGHYRVSGGTVYAPADAPPHFRYWRYLPGPVHGTFACHQIPFDEYPVQIPNLIKDERSYKEVAKLADEMCRNRLRAWREGNTFLNTTPNSGGRFSVEEIRPVNERYALAHVKRTLGHGRNTRSNPIYLVYDVSGHSCRETIFSADAWRAWPLEDVNLTLTASDSGAQYGDAEQPTAPVQVVDDGKPESTPPQSSDPPSDSTASSFVIYHDPDAGDDAVDRYNEAITLLEDAGISYTEVTGQVREDVDRLAGVTDSVIPRFFLNDPTDEEWVPEPQVNNGGLRWLKGKVAELTED